MTEETEGEKEELEKTSQELFQLHLIIHGNREQQERREKLNKKYAELYLNSTGLVLEKHKNIFADDDGDF